MDEERLQKLRQALSKHTATMSEFGLEQISKAILTYDAGDPFQDIVDLERLVDQARLVALSEQLITNQRELLKTQLKLNRVLALEIMSLLKRFEKEI